MTEQSISVEPQVAVDMRTSGCEAHKPTTKQIIADEFRNRRRIKHAAVIRVRRFLYGPMLKPRLRDQALQFCSFGTLVQLERLERVRTRD